MRRAVIISTIAFAIAANAVAARVEVDRARELQPVGSERMANAFRNAYATFSLPDGSHWVVHKAPAKREPSAMAVTRFGPDGSARVFLVSDWLPKGSIPGGFCGQVYGVARIDDGRVAVSGGRTDGLNAHNAVFILRAREDGGYDADRVVELPGVRQISSGPRNTILAITMDANRRGGGSLLTMLYADGRTLPLGLESSAPLSPLDAAHRAAGARVQRYADTRVALYEPDQERVILMDVQPDEHDTGATLMGINSIFIGDDPADPPLLGIDARPNGDVVVIRTGTLRGGGIGTQLAVYDGSSVPPEQRKQTVVTAHPWNFILREGNILRGVVFHDGVMLDTATLVAGN